MLGQISTTCSNLLKYPNRLLLGRCFGGFVLPVLEYCSAVWCSAADTHLRLLDRVVSVASFLTGGVFECDLAHRRSVAVLCMLYKMWFDVVGINCKKGVTTENQGSAAKYMG